MVKYMYAVLSNELLTGNKIIDEQHKELIEKINKLVKSCENGSCQLESIKILDYLSDYTEYHFREEEALQEAAGYPGIEEHKARHDEFRATVKVLHEMLVEEEGPSPAFVEAVQKNVIDWFYRHIKGFDRSVATFVQLKEQV
jgi:hemerythrin